MLFMSRGKGRPSNIEKLSNEELQKDLDEDVKELLADIKTGKTDPVFFADKILGLPLHQGQKLWLWMTTKTQPDKAYEIGLSRKCWKDRVDFDRIWNSGEFKKNILVPSNRWGKTFVTSIKHIWINCYKIGAIGSPEHKKELRCGTLNLSPHSNQCQAGYEYILDILAGKFMFQVDGISQTNNCRISNFYATHNSQKRQISFNNGTFYRAIPTGEDQASSLAGMRFLYISYDEAPQSLHLKQELPAKIMSRLIDFGGTLDIVGTPEVDKPSHQYFHHIAKLGLEAKDGWWTLIGQISDNTFLRTEEINKTLEAIKSTDPAKYRQVKYGEFVTTGKKMFDSIIVERLWDEEKPRMVMNGHQYILWADWGFSDTGDPTVFYVLDYTLAPFYRVVFRESIHGGSPVAVLTRAKILQREWNAAVFGHDASSMGGVIIKKMLREMEMGKIVDFTSAGGQKMDMLFYMINVMSAGRKPEFDAEGKVKELNPDFGRLRSYYIPELEEQLGNYQYNPDKGVSDKRIEQDDVMALGMAIWWLERKFMKKPVGTVQFNPLAADINHVFPLVEARKLGMKTITIPERRLM